MKYDPDIHRRRSVRLAGYDYSAVGAYFVTICVHGRECLFGEITDGVMELNEAGQEAERVWRELPERFPNVALDEYVIMPNHFHGIVVIHDVGTPINQGAASGAPTVIPKNQRAGRGAACCALSSDAPTLGMIMRAFKSISAIAISRKLDRQGRPAWQRNYYERIIRDERELAAVREYIRYNPQKWGEDGENPAYAPHSGMTPP